MRNLAPLLRRTRLAWAVAVAVAATLFGTAPSGQAQTAPTAGPPPGDARIWIYREYQPYVTLARPYVRLNGQVIGISEPGGAFYRDVPPGTYRITIDSRGEDVNQFATVAAVAGQTVFVKTDANTWWAAINPNYEVDTFYTFPVLPQEAQAEMMQTRIYDGS